MYLKMLKGKIHRAVVKQAELHYVGSITVDPKLLEAAGILEYEKMQAYHSGTLEKSQSGDRFLLLRNKKKVNLGHEYFVCYDNWWNDGFL